MHQITMMKILQPLILLTTLRNDIDLSPNHPLSDHDDIEVSNIIRHKEITKRSLNPLRLPLLVPASNNSNINSNNFSPLLSTPNNSNINHNNVSSGASQFDSIFGLNDGAIDSVHDDLQCLFLQTHQPQCIIKMTKGTKMSVPMSSKSSKKESINPQMEEIAAFVDKSVTVHVLNRWLNATKMDELRAKIQW
ncbi:12814_t:CDS:2 [Rhizophagus irregularis]|nr:12814_t:CDS:2 [Rhizophagus irregularis]